MWISLSSVTLSLEFEDLFRNGGVIGIALLFLHLCNSSRVCFYMSLDHGQAFHGLVLPVFFSGSLVRQLETAWPVRVLPWQITTPSATHSSADLIYILWARLEAVRVDYLHGRAGQITFCSHRAAISEGRNHRVAYTLLRRCISRIFKNFRFFHFQ